MITFLKPIRKLLFPSLLYVAVAVFFCLLLYAATFPRQIRCLFVSYSALQEVQHNIYVDQGFSRLQQAHLVEQLGKAHARVSTLFGPLQSTPIIITGSDASIMHQFGTTDTPPGMSHNAIFGTYIVLAPEGLNIDVISHEIAHAELIARVGWLKKETHIPAWFDEGLAMSADYRYNHSEAIWRLMTNEGKDAPTLEMLADMKDFMAISKRSPYLSYYTAKREVGQWLAIASQAGLIRLLEEVRQGKDFHESYTRIAKDALNKDAASGIRRRHR